MNTGRTHFKKGSTPWNKDKKGVQVPWNKGIKDSKQSGESHGEWKGELASYSAKHMWIRYHFGNAKKCENIGCCYPRLDRRGKLLKKPGRYEWANLSGDYKRNKNDWAQLCASCHRLFDHKTIALNLIER